MARPLRPHIPSLLIAKLKDLLLQLNLLVHVHARTFAWSFIFIFSFSFSLRWCLILKERESESKRNSHFENVSLKRIAKSFAEQHRIACLLALFSSSLNPLQFSLHLHFIWLLVASSYVINNRLTSELLAFPKRAVLKYFLLIVKRRTGWCP